MKKIEFDILMLLKDKAFDVVEFARALFKDDDSIKQAYEELTKDGYIENGIISSKGSTYLDDHRIDNAIILSAGMSTRFVPLSYEKPKGLLEVKGEVLIERQIRQLHEKGINEIVVVVGFMKEQFYYLIEKYGVILVETNDYSYKNNHASVYAAKKYLKNTIITSSDLYFANNIFQAYAYDSYYCSIFVPGKTAERGLITDEDDRILKTMYGDKCFDVWVSLGYAFFSKRFSETMISILDNIIDLPETYNKFWADIQDENLEVLYMYVKRCDESEIYEFDSLEELREFDSTYKIKSGSIVLHKLSYLLAASEESITEIETLRTVKKSMFKFKCKNNYYICDIDPDEREKIYCLGRSYYQCRDFKDSQLKLYKMDKNIRVCGINQIDIKDELEEIYNYSKDFIEYHKRALPLCAAENVISPFANLPMSYGFQERYIMNNTYSFNMADNFIGCEKLFPFYQKLSDVCERIFNARYTDARPFSGMHCIDMITKTVCRPGEKMMILDKEHGGHASVKPVVERLGVKTYSAPYILNDYDLDYHAVNKLIKEEEIKYILLAPSDIIWPLNIEKIDTSNCILMWDCSQLLGLIAAGLVPNPLNSMKNIIMFGGTHKTFPGPASGLIMTNEKYLHDLMETEINPKYLRHSQMHQKVSLLFALIEFEKYGADYMRHMVHCSNYLGERLEKKGFDVAKINGQTTWTHQVFIRTDEGLMNTIYDNAYKCEVTLNKKHKALFNGFGIRLGTQEIARYDWNDDALDVVAEIILKLGNDKLNSDEVMALMKKLPDKKIHFAFSEDIITRFNQLSCNW